MVPPARTAPSGPAAHASRAVPRGASPKVAAHARVPFASLLAASMRRAPPAPPPIARPAPPHTGPAHAKGDPKAGPALEEHKGRALERVGEELDEKKDKKRAPPVDPLDPQLRSSAQLAPPPAIAASVDPATNGEAVTSRARVSMEELLPLVVRRIAWGGDKTKAAVHVELGTGSFAGTTVTVHAEGRRVRLELGGAGDLDALRARLESRLRAAGIDVEAG